MEKLLVTGVAADSNTARVSVIGVEDKPGTAFRIFNTLAKNHINVDIILQSVGRDGTKDISIFAASLTVVPSLLFKLERTTNSTLYFFAISTERL